MSAMAPRTDPAWKEALRPYYLKWLYFHLFPERMPVYFRDCWSYPEVALSAIGEALGAGGGGPDVVFLPMTDWHTRIQRTQHLARSYAARGHRCFVLNPHLGREFPGPPCGRERIEVRQLAPGIVELHVQLPREPVFHHRLLSVGESAAVGRLAGEALAAAGVRNPIQMVSFPLWQQTAERLRKRFGGWLIYDCHDVLEGFTGIAPSLVEAEAAAMRSSDLVLFSSGALKQSHTARDAGLKEKSVLVRNGVDQTMLERGSEGGARRRPGAARVAGYAGALDWWFERDWLAHAASAHPEWRFALAGRVEDAAIDGLRQYPNIEFAGEVTYVELPQYLERCDAGLIPFQRNALTMGTNPIKLYEYFAFGLPVVATRLPELEPFEDLVYFADSAPRFTAALERALSETDGDLRRQRQAIARQETWAARVDSINRAVQEIIGS
jgi:O-antigen biosynthesis protein